MKTNFIKHYGIKPADRIVTPKSNLNIVKHHAIYLGQNHQGIDLIIENVIGEGVKVVTASDFFNRQLSITRIEKYPGSDYNRAAAVKVALQNIGQPYDLINFNCESFANLVQYGHKSSSQSNTGLFLAVTVMLIALIGMADS